MLPHSIIMFAVAVLVPVIGMGVGIALIARVQVGCNKGIFRRITLSRARQSGFSAAVYVGLCENL